MIKKLIKKIGARKVVNMLTQTSLGRALLRKSIIEVSKKLDIPVTAEQNADNASVWMFRVGKPEAHLHLQCYIHVDTIADLAEVASNACINDTMVGGDEIMAILQSATNVEEQIDSNA